MTELNRLSVKDWSPEDRPREKLLSNGVNTLSNAELLAVILHFGTKNETVVELSQRILKSFGNDLNSLGKASVNQLISKFYGIGKAKAISIIAALELGKRRNAEDIQNKGKILCSIDIYNYFHPLLCDLPHEEFWALFLNHANKIINKFKISQGGVNQTVVDPKIIFKEALANLASYVVLCHNHPSGSFFPSSQDNSVTQTIKKGLDALDMRLIDHVILTDGGYFSFADEGKI